MCFPFYYTIHYINGQTEIEAYRVEMILRSYLFIQKQSESSSYSHRNITSYILFLNGLHFRKYCLYKVVIAFGHQLRTDPPSLFSFCIIGIGDYCSC